jgi:hypothetical protein
MLKLLSFYSVTVRLKQHCLVCIPPLAQLISQTYFMPFALTSNAIVARIFAITCDILPSIQRAWSLMAVALARAPPHSNPPPKSIGVFTSALPAISAPLELVHGAAIQQFRGRMFLTSTDSDDPSACGFQSDARDVGVRKSFDAADFGSVGTCMFSQDDLGIPIHHISQ